MQLLRPLGDRLQCRFKTRDRLVNADSLSPGCAWLEIAYDNTITRREA